MDQTWIGELPLVAAFVFFCITLIKLFLDFLKARDESWQSFLADMRELDRLALAELADEIKVLTREFTAHDHETRGAIGVLKGQTIRAKMDRAEGGMVTLKGDGSGKEEQAGASGARQ